MKKIKIDGYGRSVGRGIVLLEYITLPPNLKKIERHAFGYCEQLKEIDLPAETTEIEDEAFLWCNNISRFVVHTSNPNIAVGNYAVYCKLGNTTLYVPRGAKEAFQQHDAWKGFAKIEEYDDLNAVNSVMVDRSKLKYLNDTVFTVDGKYVGKDTNSLDHGIYIVNGKKISK